MRPRVRGARPTLPCTQPPAVGTANQERKIHSILARGVPAMKRRRSAYRPFRSTTRLALEPLEARIAPAGANDLGLLLLDPATAGALEVSGNANVQIADGMAVINSSSSAAVEVKGRGSVSLVELDIVGAPGTRI